MTPPKESNLIGIGLVIAAGAAIYAAFADDRPDPGDWNLSTLPKDERPTMTRQAARVVADTVDAAVWADNTFWSGWPVGSWTENEDLVVKAMTDQAIRTTGDVLQIAEAYGARSEGIAPELTLLQTLQKYLSAGNIETINAAWSSRRITIRI